MFGLNRKNTEAEKETFEPVHFHVELSTQLIDSQSVIYSRFKAIATLLADGDHSKLEATLSLFKREFHTYILDKNIKVFSYLKECVVLEEKEEIAVNNSRAMNRSLSRSVNRFLDLYLKEGVLHLKESQKSTFEQQLKQLGKEIAEVMRDERDSLFPIYDRQGNE